MSNEINIELDVLICAYNEAAHIPRALESLRAQTVGPRSFRVIFVDNASKDNTRQVVAEHSHGLNLEYVYEVRPGLNMARNAGYSHASASYVAHIDADATADPRWVENILQVIRQEQPDLCGGPYFPYYITAKPAWFLDAYNASQKGDRPRYLEKDEFLNGTNMIWRRSVVEQLGGFNADVGLMARGFTRGDETHLIVHARKMIPDFRAFYHPGIIVYHLTRDEWFSLRYWLRCYFSQGVSDYAMWEGSAKSRPRFLRMAQFLASAAMVGAKGTKALILRDRKEYPYWKNYYFERMLPETYRLGGIWRLTKRRSDA